jgi:glycine cleavage system regulatory protein
LNGIKEKIPGIQRIANGGSYKYEVKARKVSLILKDLANLCYEHNIDLENMSVRKPTLEDVFLALTGRKLRE